MTGYPGGKPDDLVVEVDAVDASRGPAAFEALRHRARLFSGLTDALPIGVVQIDHGGSVELANKRLAAVLGVPADELTLEQLLAPLGPDERQLLRLALDRALDHGADDELEVDVNANGVPRRCAISIVSVANEDGTASALVCVNDITKSAQLRDDLRARATIDVLTGCHNRDSAITALDVALVDSSGATGVLFIDLDDFKPVNDVLGHAVGDELLRAVVTRLKETCRGSDLVGRLGGDEFLVVCRDLCSPAEDMDAIARRIHLALHHPFLLKEHTIEVGASIGVACAAPGMDAEQLVSRADRAMYVAKRDRNGPALAPVGDH